jgi:hypothetical protein
MWEFRTPFYIATARVQWIAILVLGVSAAAAAQGVQPMTPQLWEQARQEGMRGEVPPNVPLLHLIDAAQARGDAALAARVLQHERTDPFYFRVLSPYIQAADAARDPAKAARMAKGVISPETMVVYLEVTQSKYPEVPVVDVVDAVIQRGNRIFHPVATLPQDNVLNKNGQTYRAREADFAFPVEVFAPTAPITIVFTGAKGASMMWEMSIADLQALK